MRDMRDLVFTVVGLLCALGLGLFLWGVVWGAGGWWAVGLVLLVLAAALYFWPRLRQTR